MPPFEPWILEIRDRLVQRFCHAPLPGKFKAVFEALGLSRSLGLTFRPADGWTAVLDVEMEARLGRIASDSPESVAERLRFTSEARALNQLAGASPSMKLIVIDAFWLLWSQLGTLAWSEATRLDPVLAQRWFAYALDTGGLVFPPGLDFKGFFESSDASSRAGNCMLEHAGAIRSRSSAR